MAVSMNGQPRPCVIQKELALLEDAPTSANSYSKKRPEKLGALILILFPSGRRGALTL